MTARQSAGRLEVWSAKSPSVAIGVTVQVEAIVVGVLRCCSWWLMGAKDVLQWRLSMRFVRVRLGYLGSDNCSADVLICTRLLSAQ